MSDANENELDLNLLATLDTLLTERSVTRAAARLGLTQSAVSHRLKALRAWLSDPLLVGSRRGLVLTERAQAMAEPLRRALFDARAALRAGDAFDPATARRTFVVATNDVGELAVYPRMLETLAREAPGISISSRIATRGIAAELAAGTLDVCVGVVTPPAAGLMRRIVGEERDVVLLRRGHPALKRRLTAKSYAALEHVTIAVDTDAPSNVDRALAERGLTRRVVVRVGHYSTAPFLVAHSDLVLSTPSSVSRVLRAYVPLVELKHPLRMAPFPVAMIWHERSHTDPAHAWFRALVERMTREAMPRPRRPTARLS